MFISSSSLYKKSPVFLQNLLVSMNGYFYTFLRQGRNFKKILKELEVSQWYSKNELEELQNEKLRKLIEHVYKNVLYYREIFDTRKLKPKDIKTKEDLKKLPFLTKEDVRKNRDKLLAQNFNRSLLSKAYTSGTTGTPLDLFRDIYSINFENASILRQWRWAGYKFDSRRAVLRGDLIVPAAQTRPPFWRYNTSENALLMSSYHLSSKNIPYYLSKIEKFRPDYIQAYPSSIHLLAAYMKENKINAISLKAVFTSSEMVTPKIRALTEEYFCCQVYDYYGLAERVIPIMTCEKGRYHVIPEYGIAEFITFDGDKTELIGTGLTNFAMPLIRYKTGDIVICDHKGTKCSCERNFNLVKEIQGRSNDFIVTPDGRKIGNPTLTHLFYGVDNNIIESQILQEKMDEIIIRVVPDKSYSDKDKELLAKKTRGLLGKSIKIKIELVDSISRTKEGKFRAVVQKMGITS